MLGDSWRVIWGEGVRLSRVPGREEAFPGHQLLQVGWTPIPAPPPTKSETQQGNQTPGSSLKHPPSQEPQTRFKGSPSTPPWSHTGQRSHTSGVPVESGDQRAHPQGLWLAEDKARNSSSGPRCHSHLSCTCWQGGEVRIPGLCPAVTPAWGGPGHSECLCPAR